MPDRGVTLYELVQWAIFFFTLIGTFFWGKSLLLMDISSMARRLYISFGPTKDDLKKMSQDKADGMIGVAAIFGGLILQFISLNWQEDFNFVINPQLHIRSLAMGCLCFIGIGALFILSKILSQKFFDKAVKSRMKAIFEAHAQDPPPQAQSQILESIFKLLGMQKSTTGSEEDFIRNIANMVSYQITSESSYLKSS